MHHLMIKQIVLESLDYQGKVDTTSRIVGYIYVTQSPNNLEIVMSIIMVKGCMETIYGPLGWEGLSTKKGVHKPGQLR